MKTSRITQVRHLHGEGDSLIEGFILGGRYGAPRVPRGIDPAQVAKFIVDTFKRDTDFLAWPKAWEAAQFYELPQAAKHLRSLVEKPQSSEGVGRPACAVRAAADVGDDADAQWAADYFDATLVPKCPANSFSVLIQTLPVLSPRGSPDKLAAKISADVKSKSLDKDKGEDQMRTFQTAQATEKNELAGARLVFDAKSKLAAQAPPDRRPDLVKIYLKLSPISGEYIETWAARMLRKEAMEVDNAPVCAEFTKALDAAVKARTEPKCAFQITRAVQAIIYLQGKPEERHVKMHEKASDPAQNFLWDDPG